MVETMEKILKRLCRTVAKGEGHDGGALQEIDAVQMLVVGIKLSDTTCIRADNPVPMDNSQVTKPRLMGAWTKPLKHV